MTDKKNRIKESMLADRLPNAPRLKEISCRIFLVAEFRGREQFRRLRVMPFRKIVSVLPNDIHDVGQSARIERTAFQVADNGGLN